jgi:hypothetical protein
LIFNMASELDGIFPFIKESLKNFIITNASTLQFWNLPFFNFIENNLPFSCEG